MAGRERRARLVGWEFEEPTPDRCSATVELDWRNRTYSGTNEETASEAGKLRSAAQATTDAVGQIIGVDKGTLELLDLDKVIAFGAPAVVVALSFHTHEPEYFVGFCPVKDEEALAAVKSVLGATNRLIQRLTSTI